MTDVVTVIERLRAALANTARATAADDGVRRRAAVCLILREGGGSTEVLLVERAQREGDPWSGHIALPGGRFETADASLAHTAIRETREETGIDLERHGTMLGQLDDLAPMSPTLPPIVVTPFAAWLHAPVELTLNHELADAFWVPISRFSEREVDAPSSILVRGLERVVPSYRIGERIVWGMTERILRAFFQHLQSGDVPR